MHQRIKNLVDHPEVAMSGKLLLNVDKVFVERIQAARQELTQVETNRWILLQQFAGMGDDMKLGRPHGANGSGVRSI